ncbi:unnamed protein product [Spirodela intermedia]|uniref:CCDC93 coiled-coil domain-containing protein n=1 Tax=Spirodela intermedia TaxID=51605 RepID=A0A7I8J942_SPIIN|nr:unnamed protein product [Spirodela intermedia]CAA6666305.1 unnamed protein product [Spirodela intermedia]
MGSSLDGSGYGLPRDLGSQDQMQNEFLLRDIEVREITLQKLEAEVNRRNLSLCKLRSASIELDRKKADLFNEIQVSREKLKNEDLQGAVERLKSMLGVLKDLEKCESDFQSSCKQQCANMQVELVDIEKGISDTDRNKVDDSFLVRSIADAHDKLNSAKRELGAKRRAILSLKRQLDDVPVQSELIQYEHQFSGLYVHIQERLQQTRQYYDTYNALLEMKELMLKELSLLNSISSQFQEAIVDTTGRLKLMDSMEAILKGTQQKLKKVEAGLHAEQKIRDSLEEEYSAAVTEHRRFSSFLKASQRLGTQAPI